MDAPHSEASAAAAVALVREGKAEALMKGSLHTDELMGAVVKRETGLRTARRISHCFVMDVPGHPEPLIITDAAVNIAPSLKDKVHIVQNAIDLARDLGVTEVRVAILSAMETVNPDVPSTLEAAALCKMADRKQITGAVLDGPLALDNAISLEAAQIKKIDSPVAGRANVLIVPDLEAGNMLAKSLSFLAGADAAGIVLGARVPIILTSRADSLMARLASCAVAAAGRERAPRKCREGGGVNDAILVLNAGSSSIKFLLFAERNGALDPVVRGQIEGMHTAPRFAARGADGAPLAEKSWGEGVSLGHDGGRGASRGFSARAGRRPRARGGRPPRRPRRDGVRGTGPARLRCRSPCSKNSYRLRRCISRTTWRRSASCSSAGRVCRRSPASIRRFMPPIPTSPGASPFPASCTTPG